MTSLVYALAWLCAWASVITQRLLIPACLLAWDLLTTEQPGAPPAPPPTMRRIGRARRFHSPAHGELPSALESLTRAQLKELAGVKGNRTKAQLIDLIRKDTAAAEYRQFQRDILPARP